MVTLRSLRATFSTSHNDIRYDFSPKIDFRSGFYKTTFINGTGRVSIGFDRAFDFIRKYQYCCSVFVAALLAETHNLQIKIQSNFSNSVFYKYICIIICIMLVGSAFCVATDTVLSRTIATIHTH